MYNKWKTYDQSVVYKASDFCDATNKLYCSTRSKLEVNTYTITYNANGGAGSMGNTVVNYGTNTTIRNNTFTKRVIHLLDGQQEQMAWMMVITGQDGVVLGNM